MVSTAACTETSRADVTSSHTSTSGLAASARDGDALALPSRELTGEPGREPSGQSHHL